MSSELKDIDIDSRSGHATSGFDFYGLQTADFRRQLLHTKLTNDFQSDKLTNDKILPPYELSSISQSNDLVSRFESVYSRLGKARGSDNSAHDLPALTTQEKSAIASLSPLQKEMFVATMGELSALQAGKVSPAEYMFDVMHKAANLAGNDKSKFVDLIGMAFSGPSYKDNERALLGTSFNPAGSLLERLYDHLVKGRASSPYSGFNPNVSDVNPDSTVTHHFREFLVLGYKHGKSAAFLANENGDDTPENNPGDLRNGYFAGMIGDALRNNKLTPEEAVNLTQSAYKLHEGKQPFWGLIGYKWGENNGSPTEGDYFLDPSQYELENWK